MYHTFGTIILYTIILEPKVPKGGHHSVLSLSKHYDPYGHASMYRP
jgi:hypothetical protein